MSIQTITHSAKLNLIREAKITWNDRIIDRIASGESEKQFDKIYNKCLKRAKEGKDFINIKDVFWFTRDPYPEVIQMLIKKEIYTINFYGVYFTWKIADQYEFFHQLKGKFEESYEYRNLK